MTLHQCNTNDVISLQSELITEKCSDEVKKHIVETTLRDPQKSIENTEPQLFFNGEQMKITAPFLLHNSQSVVSFAHNVYLHSREVRDSLNN